MSALWTVDNEIVVDVCGWHDVDLFSFMSPLLAAGRLTAKVQEGLSKHVCCRDTFDYFF